MRPRRKRKLTNYGEGHLHWIEESQLHRALMKSLREKSSKSRTSSEDEPNPDLPSPSKMPRLSVSVGTCSQQQSMNLECSVNIENILNRRRMSLELEKLDSNTSTSKSFLKKRILRSQHRRVEDSCNPSHAIMMQPRNSDTMNSKDNPEQNQEPCTTPKTESPIKSRAQRKFASNATPPENVRRSARCERKIKKKHQDNKSILIPEEDQTLKSDDRLPETKDFLNFLCFRNTPIPVKDCFSR